MNYQLVFRSRYGQLAAWGLLGFSVFFLGMVWYMDGFVQMLAALPFPIGLVYFSWWIWSFPAVIADRRGIRVRNQIRTADISWDALAKAEARWGLYLYATPDKVEVKPSPQEAVTKREAGRPLTIGDVDPVNLDPDDLASKKAIYASAVPARGGFKHATDKGAPSIPPLELESRNHVVVRTTPLVVARIIEEEKFYLDNPEKRPESHASKEAFEIEGADFAGLKLRYNWLQIGVFIVIAGYWLWRIFSM
ncbi:hypothetical protein [Actinomyces minihominis]|uniref:hypothetical protein n=1 Tax=Actinomyces minihominis TaxID=2002838 RepID=UPI000C07B995|nr:hypothetical protein [Actinomyces minihominis]